MRDFFLLTSCHTPLNPAMETLQTLPGNGTSAPPSSDFSAALYTFLDKLSPSMVGRLYEAPASCLSLFRYVGPSPRLRRSITGSTKDQELTRRRRLLPQTARHIVLNMLWYERTVSYEDAALWVRERRSDNGGTGERKCVPSPLRSQQS